MDRLTQAQQSLLQAIERLKRAMGMSPTVQELAVELGAKAPSVFEGLKRLEDKGYIRRQARKARSIEILYAQTPDKTNLTAVPVLGMVDKKIEPEEGIPLEVSTLRDQYAKSAMQGILANSSDKVVDNWANYDGDYKKGLAKICFEFADAMLEARKK